MLTGIEDKRIDLYCTYFVLSLTKRGDQIIHLSPILVIFLNLVTYTTFKLATQVNKRVLICKGGCCTKCIGKAVS